MFHTNRTATIKNSNSLHNQNGSVLLLAITFSIVLGLVGLISFKTTSADTKISSGYKKKVQCFYLAEAGIECAKTQLKNMSLYDIFISSQESGGLLINNTALGDGSYKVELSGNFDPGFTINPDTKEIRTTRDQDLSITSVTSQIYFSCGQCRCDVYSWISFNNGSTWNELFDGEPIGLHGNDDDEGDFEGIGANTKIDFKVRLYWPSYRYPCYHPGQNRYVYTTDPSDSAHFMYLKAGDPAPMMDASYGQPQERVRDVLAENNFLDENDRIIIGPTDLLVLIDLDRNPLNGGDYQDGIFYITHGSPSQNGQDQKIVITSTGKQDNGIEAAIEVTLNKPSHDSLEVLSWLEK